jgi:type IV secretory pathway VirB10-like protein
LLAFAVLVGIAAGLIYLGRTWEPLHALMSRLGRERKAHVRETATPASFIPESNGASRVHLPTLDEGYLKEQQRMAKLLEQLQKDLEALRKQKAAGEKGEARRADKPKEVRRAPSLALHEERTDEGPTGDVGTLGVWTFIPCVLETVLNSEIEGYFTIKTTEPTWDVTGTKVLIPQGQRIGAKDQTAQLLYGNERIPTFALSIALPDGNELELGEAPILDAAGTNGLTGEVDHHTWRIVWTSVLSEGLRSGQQVVQQSIGGNGAGEVAEGVARGLNRAGQERLGRAQDTRPTIIAEAGDRCNVLITRPMRVAVALHH